MKNIAILGSTGSIGRQTLEVVAAHPDRFRVLALAAGDNLQLLAQQIRQFCPRLAGLRDGRRQRELIELLRQDSVSASEPHISSGDESLVDIVTAPELDLVVVATAGAAGLVPTVAALRAGKNVALANKEVLVMAGEWVTTEARSTGSHIFPVDSEHSAIWQCLRGETANRVTGDVAKHQAAPSRLILTASGGPFRDLTAAELARVTVEDALRHPNWLMGKKVTVDSATLMNKGLEVLEAHWLFEMSLDNIDVLVHRESIIHSLVEFVDGSVKAQLGPPDMRLPIQYALTYPERWPAPGLPKLDLPRLRSLTFEAPDMERFPCLRLALEAGKQGGTYPAVLSAADDVAVGLFLEGRIGFSDIARLVESALNHHQGEAHPTLEGILAADQWARRELVEQGVV